MNAPNTPQVIPSYPARLRAVLENTETVEKLFAHIANGGDLITFCKALDVRYSDVASWITADTARHKTYSAAAEMGREWIKCRLIKELSGIGTVDIRGILGNDGQVLPPAEWPEDVARAVSGIEVDDLYEGKGAERQRVGQTKKIKLTDKLKAIELIGKEMGLFVQRHSVEVTTRLEDLVGGSFDSIPAERINPIEKDSTPIAEAQGIGQAPAPPAPLPVTETPPHTPGHGVLDGGMDG